MAKWGEGDPRWLVQERTDGANVNGWHWTEKNYTYWTKQRIDSLVKNILPKVNLQGCKCNITGIKTMDGEVIVSKRKGDKRFVMYDLTIVLLWEGEALIPPMTEKKSIKGEIKLGEIANDNDVNDYLFEVSVEGQGEAENVLKNGVLSVQMDLLNCLHQVLKELHDK